MADDIKFIVSSFETRQPLPYADGGIHAGFPSPAQDYVDLQLDFNRDIIRHPEATFYARVIGNSMKEAGILPGDLVCIDRSIEPSDGCIAVCFYDGEFTLKQLDYSRQAEGILILRPRNKDYEPILVTRDSNFEIWGVVAYTIHSFLK